MQFAGAPSYGSTGSGSSRIGARNGGEVCPFTYGRVGWGKSFRPETSNTRIFPVTSPTYAYVSAPTVFVRTENACPCELPNATLSSTGVPNDVPSPVLVTSTSTSIARPAYGPHRQPGR